MNTLTKATDHTTQSRHSPCCDERVKCLVSELAAQSGMVHLSGRDVTCVCDNFCVMACFLAPSCDAPPCRVVLVRTPCDPRGMKTEACRWHVSDCQELMELFML